MPITDLLDSVPFSLGAPAPEPSEPAPTADRVGASERPGRPSGDGASEPTGERPGLRIVTLDTLNALDLEGPPAPPSPEPPAATVAGLGERPPTTSRPPLPSWAVAATGGLALLSIALIAALAVALTGSTDAVAPSADPAATRPAPADAATPPAPSPASFPADPSPIPVDLLTRLEEASNEPLDVELSRLLDAIQHGFGRRSAQLEPTLRSYVYRMGSRFEWNPDTFRVAATAPDPALAAARAALLERLFEDAVAAGRLDVGTGVGPDALTLVTE
ncbi:hypothetical protein [Rubrivirga sp.]|uniref:hypothetical protein n=1 Tax=Rubrivirga sp. TaxID=1885344 RepID=UPI003B5256EA